MRSVQKATIAALLLLTANISYAASCLNLKTQWEITECTANTLKEETDAINSVYNRYRVELDTTQKQQLKEVQLAWIKYKDLACKFNASRFDGGSMQPSALAQCLTEQTIIRRKQLEELFHPYQTSSPAKSKPATQPQVVSTQNNAPQTMPYGNCPQRAEIYQKRYERLNQSSDLVCYQKALERELSGEQIFSCPLSAQYYQTAYERNANSSDLVCYQQALERELK